MTFSVNRFPRYSSEKIPHLLGTATQQKAKVTYSRKSLQTSAVRPDDTSGHSLILRHVRFTDFDRLVSTNEDVSLTLR